MHLHQSILDSFQRFPDFPKFQTFFVFQETVFGFSDNFFEIADIFCTWGFFSNFSIVFTKSTFLVFQRLSAFCTSKTFSNNSIICFQHFDAFLSLESVFLRFWRVFLTRFSEHFLAKGILLLLEFYFNVSLIFFKFLQLFFFKKSEFFCYSGFFLLIFNQFFWAIRTCFCVSGWLNRTFRKNSHISQFLSIAFIAFQQPILRFSYCFKVKEFFLRFRNVFINFFKYEANSFCHFRSIFSTFWFLPVSSTLLQPYRHFLHLKFALTF